MGMLLKSGSAGMTRSIDGRGNPLYRRSSIVPGAGADTKRHRNRERLRTVKPFGTITRTTQRFPR